MSSLAIVRSLYKLLSSRSLYKLLLLLFISVKCLLFIFAWDLAAIGIVMVSARRELTVDEVWQDQ